MRPRALGILLFLVAFACDATSTQDPAEVTAIFQSYVELNEDYLSSVKAGTGKSGKSYQQLSREISDYSEGPLEEALEVAVQLVCQSGQPVLIGSLLELQQSTINSASESPATALGRMFVCQPETFSETFTSMDRSSRDQLYSLVEFGFENAILDYPTTGADIEALTAKLNKLQVNE